MAQIGTHIIQMIIINFDGEVILTIMLMHCIQIKILFHQNLKLSMILLKMLLGKDMGP